MQKVNKVGVDKNIAKEEALLVLMPEVEQELYKNVKAGKLVEEKSIITDDPNVVTAGKGYFHQKATSNAAIDRIFQSKEMKKHLLWCTKEMKTLHRSILDSMIDDGVYERVHTSVTNTFKTVE